MGIRIGGDDTTNTATRSACRGFFDTMKHERDAFYWSAKWLRARAGALRRAGYMCQLSKRRGILRPAEIVHHIFPREFFPEYELCDWNLIALTRAEHNKLHDRETDELTAEGVGLLRRTAQAQGIPFPARYKYESDERKRRQRMARGLSRYNGMV